MSAGELPGFTAASQAALRAVGALLDHVLAQQPQGRQRLLPHAGKTLQLRAGALDLRMRVGDDTRLQPVRDEAAAPQLQLDVDVARWMAAQLRGGAEAALAGVRIAGDPDSYRYLAESIRKHPDQATLKQMMEQAGFAGVQWYNLSAGVVALHVGLRA